MSWDGSEKKKKKKKEEKKKEEEEEEDKSDEEEKTEENRKKENRRKNKKNKKKKKREDGFYDTGMSGFNSIAFSDSEEEPERRPARTQKPSTERDMATTEDVTATEVETVAGMASGKKGKTGKKYQMKPGDGKKGEGGWNPNKLGRATIVKKNNIGKSVAFYGIDQTDMTAEQIRAAIRVKWDDANPQAKKGKKAKRK
jgi:hypothetical protein